MRYLLLFFLATNLPAQSPSEKIDAFIDTDLRQAATPKAPRLDDHAFARRAYLSLVGRIPTLQELRKFIGKPDRSALIDRLLKHPGRMSHDFNFWADLLRLKERVPGVPTTSTRAYANWLRAAIAANRPYDQMVSELIAAEGYAGENGAVGFYQRDRGMPLDHLANTAQTFLGTRLVCAQCHDHPTEDWSQMEFFQLAAFSAPMETWSLPHHFVKQLPKIKGQLTRREWQIKGQSFSAITRPFRNSLVEYVGRPLPLPHDYQYDDAKPKDLVNPDVPFGPNLTFKSGEKRITAYARWVTHRDNPRFAKVIANRLWRRIMGIGLIEPVDDLDAGRTIGNPKLLDYLAQLVRDTDFDLIAFQRNLYGTDLFQRRAVAYASDQDAAFLFSGPRHRRLSSEQIWDNLGILSRADLDDTIQNQHTAAQDKLERNSWRGLNRQSLPDLLKRTREVTAHLERAAEVSSRFRTELEDIVANQDNDRATAWLERVIKTTDQDLARYTELTWLGKGPHPARLIGTAYLNLRQQLAQLAIRNFPHLRPRYVEYFFAHHPNSVASRAEKAQKAAIDQEYQHLLQTTDRRSAETYRRTAHLKMRTQNFVRASELSNPAPETHYLRELGQSDRELINNSRRDSTIPQLLELRNGLLGQHFYNSETALWKNLAGLEDSRKIIDLIFQQVLTRPATEPELAMLQPEFEQRRDEGIKTSVWVILNSTEFVFAP